MILNGLERCISNRDKGLAIFIICDNIIIIVLAIRKLTLLSMYVTQFAKEKQKHVEHPKAFTA